MEQQVSLAHDVFPHIRIVMGMVIGLGVTRLLSGVARIVQHPKHYPLYFVHLLWVVAIFVMLIHFWWWEFGLFGIVRWSFGAYLFVLLYAVALFMLCAFLFPESMTGYQSYEDFFYAKRAWFFGLLVAVFTLDVGDTLLKGHEYYTRFGAEYLIRTPLLIVLSLVAIWTDNRKFHTAFVVFLLVYQGSWIIRLFDDIL